MTLQDDARDFLPLSPRVFQVLLSLHTGPTHGYAIIQDIRARTSDELRLTASTLYDALARLVAQGLIREVRAKGHRDADARRRYYELTGLGRLVTSEEVRRLERLLRDAHATAALRRRTAR